MHHGIRLEHWEIPRSLCTYISKSPFEVWLQFDNPALFLGGEERCKKIHHKVVFEASAALQFLSIYECLHCSKKTIGGIIKGCLPPPPPCWLPWIWPNVQPQLSERIPLPLWQILPSPPCLYGRLNIEHQLRHPPPPFCHWLVHRFLLRLPDGRGRPVKNSRLCYLILNLVISSLQLLERQQHVHSETESRLGTYFTPARADNTQRRAFAPTLVWSTTSP